MNEEPAVPPPRYSGPEPPDFPPDYSAGTIYSIGSHSLYAPLVRISHVKAHLCLLRAIHTLKAIIMDGEDTRLPEEILAMEPWERWTWFAGLAVERFERWVTSVQAGSLQEWVQEELPPVDVLMVWQAYMLNPMWYAEDCDRIPMLRTLRSLGGRLLSSLVEVGDISEHVPSSERRDRWLEQTHTNFDPLDAAILLKIHSIECPQCASRIDCPFITSNGTGYIQHDFAAQCTNCGLVLTRESLGVVKFAHDFVIDPGNREDVETYGDGVCLAGTLRSVKKGITKSRAQTAKTSILDTYPLKKPTGTASKWEWEQHIFKVTGYSMKTVTAAILSAMTTHGYNVQRVLSAYADDRPFSVNLIGAVVRHSTFVDDIYNARWLEVDHFGEDAEDNLVFNQAISRYHAYLDLTATSTEQVLFVPTLDIDLVWHTHQMMGDLYHAKCAKYLQRLVDHYDRVEQNMLAFSFDATCRAWRERYGLPYTFCGCPLPGDKIGERVSRLKQRLTKPLHPTGDLVPLQREDALLATHVSVHNAFPAPGYEQARQKRLEKTNKRQERDRKKERDGTPHDPAFLRLLPIYNGPGGASVIPGDRNLQYSWVMGGGGGNDGFSAADATDFSRTMYHGPIVNSNRW